MVTGYEVDMYRDISRIRNALERIAECMEANERRARETEEREKEVIEELRRKAAEG